MEVKILEQQNLLGREITVYGTKENPLFLAKDVAEWIEYSNVSRMINLVDDHEVVKVRPNETLGLLTTNNEYNFLTEDGLYEVLMLSRKPIAKEFKRGIKLILKQVRTKGGYIATSEKDTPELIMARAIQVASQTIENYKMRTRQLEMQTNIQQQQIEAQQPMVNLAKECYSSTGTMTASILSSRLGFKSANALNTTLKNLGVQYKIKGDECWKLTSKYACKGYTKTIPFPYLKSDGTTGTRNQMEWTEAGFVFLREFLTNK